MNKKSKYIPGADDGCVVEGQDMKDGDTSGLILHRSPGRNPGADQINQLIEAVLTFKDPLCHVVKLGIVLGHPADINTFFDYR